MKKYAPLFLLLIALFICPSAALNALAAAKEYALIGENCLLFRTADASETVSNVYFLLPADYFVEITGSEGEFYRCAYDDLTGYVKKTAAQKVTYTPKSIYPSDQVLKLNNDGSPVNVRSVPEAAAEYIVGSIPAAAGSFKFYNYTSGAQIVPSIDKWYFISYKSGDAVIRGYVYSAYVLVEKDIPENDISAAIVQEPGGEDPPDGDDSLLNDKIMQVVVVIAIAIPAIFIVYLLFKKQKSARQ